MTVLPGVSCHTDIRAHRVYRRSQHAKNSRVAAAGQDPAIAGLAARYIRLLIPALVSIARLLLRTPASKQSGVWMVNTLQRLQGFLGTSECLRRYLMTQGIINPATAIVAVCTVISIPYNLIAVRWLGLGLDGAALGWPASRLSLHLLARHPRTCSSQLSLGSSRCSRCGCLHAARLMPVPSTGMCSEACPVIDAADCLSLLCVLDQVHLQLNFVCCCSCQLHAADQYVGLTDLHSI